MRTLFAIFMIIMFLACFTSAVSKTYYGLSSRSWPTARGTVKRSEMVVSPVKWSFHYRPRIEYRYVVDTESFQGSLLAYDSEEFSDREVAQSILKRYELGKEIEVYYDPRHSEKSVLIPGINFAEFYTVFPLSGMFLLLGWVVYRGESPSKSQSQSISRPNFKSVDKNHGETD